MGSGPKRVAVLGNFSGRNAGDAAILGGLLRDLTRTFPRRQMRFEIPTIKPGFVARAYVEYPVRPISLLPTNLSLKILGLPVVRCVLGADLVLVTDAILFDRRLYNPLFNYLHTLSWVLPLGARRGVPVVLYNVSLGPVTTPAGRKCLKRVLEASRKVIVRDRLSADLAREIDPGGPEPRLAADCALSVLPAPAERVAALAREHGVLQSGRPTLGFNVNAYVDTYVRGSSRGIGDEVFQQRVAAVIDRAVRTLGVDVLLVETQPMDLRMARGVLERVQQRARVGMVANPPLGHAEIAGFLGRLDAFVGMRTHSLILAASMHTPLGGIIAYPKNRGFLESIDCGDQMLEFRDFSEENLWALVRRTWEGRASLRRRLQASVERERAKAEAAARELDEWLGESNRTTARAETAAGGGPGLTA
jgi:polysaccharide pyruvyl transferase WcaK-like protein